ncbi:hypothetical protein AVEN_205599-1 [Araneus ventricosus]|uniref:Uncharacterized protein n=1 Tax=Araneus ventricosus TaxID=182803 RepID=A0A4Y2F7H0_ARAVE|nr:hypothetical protein AVEN_205599-1 [Araneus ventricosus]
MNTNSSLIAADTGRTELLTSLGQLELRITVLLLVKILGELKMKIHPTKHVLWHCGDSMLSKDSENHVRIFQTKLLYYRWPWSFYLPTPLAVTTFNKEEEFNIERSIA